MAGGSEIAHVPLKLSSRAGVHPPATHVGDMDGLGGQVNSCIPAKHTFTRRRLKRLRPGDV